MSNIDLTQFVRAVTQLIYLDIDSEVEPSKYNVAPFSFIDYLLATLDIEKMEDVEIIGLLRLTGSIRNKLNNWINFRDRTFQMFKIKNYPELDELYAGLFA